MTRILVLGAGRSSSVLIRYLLDNARTSQWQVVVADASIEAARKKIGSSDAGEAVAFDINEPQRSDAIIQSADIVISLLPPDFHPLVALRCLAAGKHFLTASYLSPELKAMDNEIRSKGLLFVNECGLDPGIDHLSAMQMIDDIRRRGGTIKSFESFTGGLIAPQTDPENPWRYKFTWNPRNVVTAGQNGARYLYEGRSKHISYSQLFKRVTPIHVPGNGYYEGYVNRDSLQYVATYGLDGIATMVRGTLRHAGFCAAWDVLVQLGCCDDDYQMENVADMTHADFIDSFLPPMPGYERVEDRLCLQMSLGMDSAEVKMLKWSGFFDPVPIGLHEGSPARILEYILNKKWAMNETDVDQIIMWHRFKYLIDGGEKEIDASLIATGTDSVNTAMAKTVGLPLGIATKLIAEKKVRTRGAVIPVMEEFYRPILGELKAFGISLNEVEVS
ncbi:MAG TPA: saccharopine dehydrogenase C-terminal domain-containing protein [Chryseosolibacter sp.]|nr:saccharopine dehydrogenase C-terminal domain-containing protein [Chryseosolibacter sp.]